MFVINSNIENEIVINKSRFICLLIKVNNEAFINKYLDEIKNTYKDATHYCYSYIIGNTKRFNDDGEPGGTAGMPILNVLENNELTNILCVVVRYFGGIKLGAGGLVRAYTNAVTSCLANVKLNKLIDGKNLTIKFNYDKVKYIDNILKDVKIINKTFDNEIIYSFDISNDSYNQIISNLENNTNDINIIDNIKIEEI